jgi:tetratricopeptide (TPR) repeat protein
VELIRQKQKAPELEYIFKHALVQESTYESILLKKRLELHGKVASAIESLFSERLDEFLSILAYHYAKAELWEKAQEYLFKAGDQAGRIAADAEALAYYHQAIETYMRAFGDRWEPEQRAILERKMGEAFYRRGEYGEAIQYLEKALRYLEEPLPMTKWRVRIGILREIAVQVAHRFLPGVFVRRPETEPDGRVTEVERVYEVLSVITYFGNRERLPLLFLRTVNYPERNGDAWGAARGYVGLALVSHLMPWPTLNKYYTKKAVTALDNLTEPQNLAYKHFTLSIRETFLTNRFIQGEMDGIRAASEFRKAGYWNSRLWVFATSTTILCVCFRGDFQAAVVQAEDLVRYGEDSNDLQAWCWGLALLGWAQTTIGRFEEGIKSLKKAERLANRIPDYLCRVRASGNLAHAYLMQGDWRHAVAVAEECHLLRAVQRVPGEADPLLGALSEANLMAAEQSEGDQRELHFRKAKRAISEEMKDGKGFGTGLPEALRHRGTYEWLKGRKTSAQKWWARSLTAAEIRGMRYQTALSHLEAGIRLQDRGHLHKAESMFAGTGADWDRERTRGLLNALGARK